MYYDDMMLVVLKGHEFSYKTIRDLKGKILGKSRGSSYGDEYEQGRKEIFKVDEDGDGLQRLKKLLYGRIDVALVGPGKAAVNQTINDDPELLARKDDFVILEKPFTRDPNYLGFAKSMKKQEFLKEFNRILQKGIADGTIQGIIDKYSNH